MSPAWLVVFLLGLIALLLLVTAVLAFRGRRVGGGLASLVTALVLAVLATAIGAAAWAFAGFQALTRETVAATLRIERDEADSERFTVHVDVVGGEERTIRLRGDQVVVDAYIVKWHPWANALGLATAYRLDRIGGRFRSIDDERTQPRTVEPLSEVLPGMAAQLFATIEGSPWLEPLVDARYGSGTFVSVDTGDLLEVRVSTSGLLVRPLSP